MSEILETLESNGQLGKVLYELLEQVATSAVLKANEKDQISSSMVKDQALPLCKSVPILSGDNTRYVKKAVADNENQNEKSQTTKNITVVDSSLGRPRYQWHESDSDTQGQRRTVSRDLFSVFVGHLPTDITRGELEDLFGDTGEVVETHVCPPANGHSYTYGFVRFYTLEEAKDAVREKNLKVIGSRQINVELSSSTRRNLQMKPDDEDGRPLLQREYPKVQRPSNGDENQVIEKLKASLRRLRSDTVSSLGDYNPDEVFENIKSVLKMLINYPMTLADPSTDMREDKSRSDSSVTKHQTLTRSDPTHSQKNFFSEVVDQHTTEPKCQISSRLPSLALEATCNVDKLTNSVIVEENNSVKTEHRKLNVTNKILEYLNSSSGEDNASPGPVKRSSKKIPYSRHSWSTSSTDDELLGKSTIPDIKPTLKTYKKPHTRSKEHQRGSSPLTAANVDNDIQIHDSSNKRAPSKASHNMPEIIATHASPNSDASIGSASCTKSFACPTIVKNGQPPRNTACCSSDNGLLRLSAQESLSSNYTVHVMPEYQNQQHNNIFGQKSCSTDFTNGPVHGTSLPSLSLKISPKVIEQTCLLPDFTDQELKGISEDVQRHNNDKSQVDDLLSEKGGKRSQFRSSPRTENILSQYTTLSSRAHPLSSPNKTLVQQPVLCTSANGNFQQNEDFACTKGQNSQEVSEQQENWSKQACQTSFRVSQLNENAASNNGYDFSSQLHRALDMDEVDAQVSKDDSTDHRNLLPDRSCPSLLSRNPTEVVNDLPRKSRNEDYHSNYAEQSQESPSPPKSGTSLNSYGVPFENGKLRPQAQNTNLSHPVLQLFDSFSQESSDSAPFTNKKGLKSPGRRVLAPSFSFSSSTKGEGSKIQTNVMPAAECCVGNLPVDMTVKSKSKKIGSVMVNDSSIVGISEKNVWKSTFDMSEVDLGIEDNDNSESAMSGPAFESAKSILDSSCPSNDVEIIQLKDMLDKNVRKLEELQQTCNTYPQRRRQRFAPNLFNGYARSSQLERQIHDAEVLLHKKEEMWSARSNERELAYEKELLHSTNSDPLLSQFAREMKRDSLCNLNNITDLKCKILQLKIEHYQLQESAQR